MFAVRSNKLFFFFIALWLGIAGSFRQLAIPDEGRYGDITRWMMETGDWLTPRINGVPFFHKPPLLHWMGGGLMEVFGVHVWVMRLVPVIAAMVMLIGMFWFVRRHADAKHSQQLARTSVLILASSVLFYGSSQYINHDLLVAAWISLTVFALADYAITNTRASLYLGYTAAALALLSKGLIGVLIPGMILLPWLLAAGYWRRIPALLHPYGILLFAVIVTPWLYLVEQKYPNFTHYFFIEQQFDRFSSGGFNNVQPWPFYLVCLLVSFLPWLLLTGKRFTWKPAGELLNKNIFMLLVWWAVSVTVFFSIPPSKLGGYILPAVAPIAIYLACVLHHAFSKDGEASTGKIWNWLALGYLGILTAALFALPHIRKTAKQLTGNEPTELLIIALVLLACIIAIVVLFKQGKIKAFQVTLLSSLLICTAITFAVKFLDHKSSSDQLAFAKDLTPTMPLVFYHAYYYDIPFMLDRRQPVYWVEEWAKVKGDNGAAQIKDGLRFEPQQAHLLWTDADLTARIQNGEQMMILVPKSFSFPALAGVAPHLQERNFNVYLTGQKTAVTAP